MQTKENTHNLKACTINTMITCFGDDETLYGIRKNSALTAEDLLGLMFDYYFTSHTNEIVSIKNLVDSLINNTMKFIIKLTDLQRLINKLYGEITIKASGVESFINCLSDIQRNQMLVNLNILKSVSVAFYTIYYFCVSNNKNILQEKIIKEKVINLLTEPRETAESRKTGDEKIKFISIMRNKSEENSVEDSNKYSPRVKRIEIITDTLHNTEILKSVEDLVIEKNIAPTSLASFLSKCIHKELKINESPKDNEGNTLSPEIKSKDALENYNRRTSILNNFVSLGFLRTIDEEKDILNGEKIIGVTEKNVNNIGGLDINTQGRPHDDPKNEIKFNVWGSLYKEKIITILNNLKISNDNNDSKNLHNLYLSPYKIANRSGKNPDSIQFDDWHNFFRTNTEYPQKQALIKSAEEFNLHEKVFDYEWAK